MYNLFGDKNERRQIIGTFHDLSVEIINLAKVLKTKGQRNIADQIERSATSICANIAESKYAHGRADFIAKLQIALKEANETGKWLEMLINTAKQNKK